MKSNNHVLVLVGLIVVSVISRLIPHPFNFTPITAIAVFSGMMFTNKRYSYVVPILAMIMSDMLLGIMKNDFTYAIHSTSLFVYGVLALIVWISTLANKLNISNVAIRTVIGSMLFFVVTNFGVWLVGGLYPLTLSGLTQCFTMAIPFYSSEAFPAFSLLGNQLFGDVLYTTLLFGSAYGISVLNISKPKTIKA